MDGKARDMKRSAAALLLLLAFATSSCAWNKPWAWSCTSAVYSGGSGGGGGGSGDHGNASTQSGSNREAGQLGVIVGILLILPLALDLVFMPVALVHDWVVCD